MSALASTRTRDLAKKQLQVADGLDGTLIDLAEGVLWNHYSNTLRTYRHKTSTLKNWIVSSSSKPIIKRLNENPNLPGIEKFIISAADNRADVTLLGSEGSDSQQQQLSQSGEQKSGEKLAFPVAASQQYVVPPPYGSTILPPPMSSSKGPSNLDSSQISRRPPTDQIAPSSYNAPPTPHLPTPPLASSAVQTNVPPPPTTLPPVAAAAISASHPAPPTGPPTQRSWASRGGPVPPPSYVSVRASGGEGKEEGHSNFMLGDDETSTALMTGNDPLALPPTQMTLVPGLDNFDAPQRMEIGLDDQKYNQFDDQTYNQFDDSQYNQSGGNYDADPNYVYGQPPPPPAQGDHASRPFAMDISQSLAGNEPFDDLESPPQQHENDRDASRHHSYAQHGKDPLHQPPQDPQHEMPPYNTDPHYQGGEYSHDPAYLDSQSKLYRDNRFLTQHNDPHYQQDYHHHQYQDARPGGGGGGEFYDRPPTYPEGPALAYQDGDQPSYNEGGDAVPGVVSPHQDALDVGRQGFGHESVGRQDVGRQDVGRQDVGRQDVGRQDVGRQDVGRQGFGHEGLGHQGGYPGYGESAFEQPYPSGAPPGRSRQVDDGNRHYEGLESSQKAMDAVRESHGRYYGDGDYYKQAQGLDSRRGDVSYGGEVPYGSDSLFQGGTIDYHEVGPSAYDPHKAYELDQNMTYGDVPNYYGNDEEAPYGMAVADADKHGGKTESGSRYPQDNTRENGSSMGGRETQESQEGTAHGETQYVLGDSENATGTGSGSAGFQIDMKALGTAPIPMNIPLTPGGDGRREEAEALMGDTILGDRSGAGDVAPMIGIGGAALSGGAGLSGAGGLIESMTVNFSEVAKNVEVGEALIGSSSFEGPSVSTQQSTAANAAADATELEEASQALEQFFSTTMEGKSTVKCERGRRKVVDELIGLMKEALMKHPEEVKDVSGAFEVFMTDMREREGEARSVYVESQQTLLKLQEEITSLLSSVDDLNSSISSFRLDLEEAERLVN